MFGSHKPVPAARTLRTLAASLEALGWAWGPTGGAGFALASGLLVHPAAAEAELRRTDDDLDRMVAAEHTAFYHGVGTCRLGAGGDGHVVDADCRVLGVDGLLVVDASIAPTVPRSNTNLLAMAVAEHAVTSGRV